MQLLVFFSFPRGWKCSLRHFSVFPSLGKLFFVLPKFGKGDFSHFLVFLILGMYFKIPVLFAFDVIHSFSHSWECISR